MEQELKLSMLSVEQLMQLREFFFNRSLDDQLNKVHAELQRRGVSLLGDRREEIPTVREIKVTHEAKRRDNK